LEGRFSMRDVDYVKLSEHYGGFLIAIGGVSITVLSIVSTLGLDPAERESLPAEEIKLLEFRSLFLSAALIVSTVCCFIGAHMMAETASFITYFKGKKDKSAEQPPKARTRKKSSWVVSLWGGSRSEGSPPVYRPIKATDPDKGSFNQVIERDKRRLDSFKETVKHVFHYYKHNWMRRRQAEGSISEWPPTKAVTFGTRLFLLASTTIFIAVILVLFSIVLLPAVSRGNTRISPIYSIIFLSVGFGTLLWMVLASQHRMPVPESWRAILIALAGGIAWGVLLSITTEMNDSLLVLTFLPVVLATVLSFVNFAWIFKDSNRACKRTFFKGEYKRRRSQVHFYDACLFGLAITFSYASLVVAGIKLKALTWPFGT
ncbi:MAG TPA: hypothetical protein VF766_12225, partial [Pyrinomonadaceae bacterium]